jgi:cyclic pyranopterin phosphate synthase
MIVDEQGRHFKSLRLSVTPYCNFACTYCVDSEGNSNHIVGPHLQAKDFANLITAINPFLGLYSIRITGGEPTLYKPLPELIYLLKTLGIPKIHLTTNGALLPGLMTDLKTSGLDSINISIDAIEASIFSKISQRSALSKTLEGIDAAISTGIFVKLNCTVLKGINDSQIVPLIEFAKEQNVIVRFLELMEMGPLFGKNHLSQFMSAKEILSKIEQKYELFEIPRRRSATANYWKTNQGHQFGIIANYSHPFCSDCNRLRLDHTGTLYGCLSNPKGTSLPKAIDNGIDLAEVLSTELGKKQATQFQGSPLSMMAIGG